ncbi:hypothetical protein [Ammoniphilus resinae]|uniref:Uncharacterized protein n=1 Tax=Ammoniphilus resinae TaxID=861532 RepID=A0ABS4GMK5_9BACL|nr:hypothetical protein [Ammoniphilus resinae]MBP1931479.1 hypothetical protein [Ammoniphilus resinae]
MFQNPLKSQELGQSDPFSSLDGGGSNQGLSQTSPFTSSTETFVSESSINPHQHFVDPHYVHGYDRADGVHVDGYWRDGDGNTDHDLTVEQGGGYFQTNPDGNLFNNLG